MTPCMYHHKNGIALRKVERDDLPKLLEMLNTTWHGRHSFPFSNLTDQSRWFDGLTVDKNNMVFAAYRGDDAVGIYKILNLNWINRTADIGRDIFLEFQHQGLGQLTVDAGIDFGFEMLGLNRISTEALVTNGAANHIVEQSGFVREGDRRQTIYRNGKFLDGILYGMLRTEWDALERVIAMGGCCNVSYALKTDKGV